ELAERKVGLQSLNDPIDTTHAQGRLVFNLFASLAEFERELIRERTQAGLSAARWPAVCPTPAGRFSRRWRCLGRCVRTRPVSAFINTQKGTNQVRSRGLAP
ncbi:recombinase family protein, partial [Pseudomonas aeruginosa]